MNKERFYDIHVFDGVNSYSVFLKVKPGVLLDNPERHDIIGHALDTGILDPEDFEYVDNVTEITEFSYIKGVNA